YLVTAARTLDLASGRCVSLERSREGRTTTALFESRDGRTLIDFEATDDHRVDVWEHWTVRGRPRGVDTLVADFAELLESARLGAPRAFDLHSPRPSHYEFCRRVLAREARVRGW